MTGDPIQGFLKSAEEAAIEYREKIEEMLGSGEFRFAEDTLIGILDHINFEGYLTEKQEHAVDNIFNSVYGDRNR